MRLNLKSLIGKLNDQARTGLEGAVGLCISRTNFDVEVEHFLTKLLESSSNDFAAIVKHFEIDKSRLTAELASSMDKLKSGNARSPMISPMIVKMVTTAWTIGSIDFNAAAVRTGFLILALVSDEELVHLMPEISNEFQKVNAYALHKDLLSIVALSQETRRSGIGFGTVIAPGTPVNPVGRKTRWMQSNRRIWALYPGPKRRH
jgi:type VI secretion system protein VasG